MAGERCPPPSDRQEWLALLRYATTPTACAPWSVEQAQALHLLHTSLSLGAKGGSSTSSPWAASSGPLGGPSTPPDSSPPPSPPRLDGLLLSTGHRPITTAPATFRPSALPPAERTPFLEAALSTLLPLVRQAHATQQAPASGTPIPPPGLGNPATARRAPAPAAATSTLSATHTILTVALKTMDRLLVDNGVHCASMHGQLFETLGPLLRAAARTPRTAATPSRSAVAASISCLGSVCMGSGAKGLPLQLLAIQLILPLLPKGHPGGGGGGVGSATYFHKSAHPPPVEKTAKACCKCILLIANENKAALTRESIPLLLPSLRSLCFYQSAPATPAFSSTHHAWGGAGGPRPLAPAQSDSDLSDATLGFHMSHDESVQFAALQCVCAVAKANPKLTYPYWHLFLDPPTPGRRGGSLLWFLRNAPSPRIRTACALVLQAFLDGSKAYLSLASEEAPSRPLGTATSASYTSLSTKLAAQIATLHEALVQALRTEREDAITIYLLRCLCALIRNVPYPRLQATDHRRTLLDACMELLGRREDINVRVCVLDCFSALLDTPVPSGAPHHPRTEELLALGVEYTSSRILVLQVAAFHLLSVLCKSAWPLVYARWSAGEPQAPGASSNNLRATVESCATTHILPLLLACFKFLEAFMHAVSYAVNVQQAALRADRGLEAAEGEGELEGDSPAAPAPATSPFPTPPNDFWTGLMDSYICMGLTHPTSDILRALACDAFSHLPEAVFLAIPARRRNAWMGLAVSIMGESDAGVKAAGARVLGVFLSYPCMYQDELFIQDVLALLPPLLDPVHPLPVRIRASWALANLCDILEHLCLTAPPNTLPAPSSFARAGADEGGVTLIPAQLWMLARACLLATKDQEKCRVNGVRALGNLIKACYDALVLTPRGMRDPEGRDAFVSEAVSLMVRNFEAGGVKTRWNACHAVANMFKHPAFPVGRAPWTPALYTGLLRTAQGAKNFKVRLSALSALQVVVGFGARERFGRTRPDARDVLLRIQALCARGPEDPGHGEGEAGHPIEGAEVAGFLEQKYVQQLDLQLGQLAAAVQPLLCGDWTSSPGP